MNELLDESEIKELLRKLIKENRHQWVIIFILEVVVLLHIIINLFL